MDPVLRTERLTLWHPHARDHEEWIALLAPEAVRRHLGGRVTSPAEEFNRLLRAAGSWALYGYGLFACRRREDEVFVGIAGVFHSWRGFGQGLDDVPEAGWIFAQSSWGQGLAGEAMRAALGWFDATHGLPRVACMIDEGNLPSLALAARLGFVRYGVQGEGEGERLFLLERVRGAGVAEDPGSSPG